MKSNWIFRAKDISRKRLLDFSGEWRTRQDKDENWIINVGIAIS